MDKENIVYIHNEIILSRKAEYNCVVWNNTNKTGSHSIKINKLNTERQISHDFTQMWGLKIDYLMEVKNMKVFIKG